MSLNIKNERVHALAREAARRTGKTQTSAIEEALERLLDGLGAEDDDAARRARLDRLLAEIDSETTDAARAATRQAQEDMYDERGLPA